MLTHTLKLIKKLQKFVILQREFNFGSICTYSSSISLLSKHFQAMLLILFLPPVKNLVINIFRAPTCITHLVIGSNLVPS